MNEKVFIGGLDIKNFATFPYPATGDEEEYQHSKHKIIKQFNYKEFDWRLSISVLSMESLFGNPAYAKVIIDSQLSFDAGDSFAQVSTFAFIGTPEDWDFKFCNSEDFPKFFSDNFTELFVHSIWDYTRLAAVYVFPAYKNLMDGILPKKTPELKNS